MILQGRFVFLIGFPHDVFNSDMVNAVSKNQFFSSLHQRNLSG